MSLLRDWNMIKYNIPSSLRVSSEFILMSIKRLKPAVTFLTLTKFFFTNATYLPKNT